MAPPIILVEGACLPHLPRPRVTPARLKGRRPRRVRRAPPLGAAHGGGRSLALERRLAPGRMRTPSWRVPMLCPTILDSADRRRRAGGATPRRACLPKGVRSANRRAIPCLPPHSEAHAPARRREGAGGGVLSWRVRLWLGGRHAAIHPSHIPRLLHWKIVSRECRGRRRATSTGQTTSGRGRRRATYTQRAPRGWGRRRASPA